MEHARFLAFLCAEGSLLSDVARGDLQREVPSCPGWTVRDAVQHLAQVYEHKIACIGLAGDKPGPWPPPEWPEDRDPIAWLDDARRRLADTLRTTDPAAPSWTWWPEDQTAGFWARRMAHETAIHRVDVQLAFGSPTPVAEDLALDGIEELLDLMLAGDWTDLPQPELTGEVTLTTTQRSWSVKMTPERVTIADGPAPAHATIEAEPSPLLLWLYGRAGDEAVAASGERDVVGRLRQRAALATQ